MLNQAIIQLKFKTTYFTIKDSHYFQKRQNIYYYFHD